MDRFLYDGNMGWNRLTLLSIASLGLSILRVLVKMIKVAGKNVYLLKRTRNLTSVIASYSAKVRYLYQISREILISFKLLQVLPPNFSIVLMIFIFRINPWFLNPGWGVEIKSKFCFHPSLLRHLKGLHKTFLRDHNRIWKKRNSNFIFAKFYRYSGRKSQVRENRKKSSDFHKGAVKNTINCLESTVNCLDNLFFPKSERVLNNMTLSFCKVS